MNISPYGFFSQRPSLQASTSIFSAMQSALSLPLLQPGFQSPSLFSGLGASSLSTGQSLSNYGPSSDMGSFLQQLSRLLSTRTRRPYVDSTPSITTVQNVAPVATAAVIPPVDTEREKLLAEAEATLKGGLFTTDELNNLKGRTAGQQYKETVARAYGGAQNAKGKKKSTKKMVQDGTWKYSDWQLAELDKELGTQYGAMSKGKKKLTDIKATADLGTTWHSTPFHMSQAQKYLDEAKKIEAYLDSRIGSSRSSSASSSSSLSSSSYSDLEAKAKELRERAGLHFQVARTTQSPIILDTDGNGKIDLTSVEDGVQFDLDGDGRKEQVAWSAAKGKDTDSWLVLDRNKNGQIDSGKELFGNQHGKANGYEELKQFDGNKDGVIDAKDAVYQTLKMWQDRNHDGVSQADEMVTLDKAGVESINLAYNESDAKDAFGNELRQISDFKRTDAHAQEIAQKQGLSFDKAKTGLALDAWLQMNKAS